MPTNSLGTGSGRPAMLPGMGDYSLGGVVTRTKTGAPLDTDWNGDAPPDGMLVGDETTAVPKLWVRLNGAWQYVPTFLSSATAYNLSALPMTTGSLTIGSTSSAITGFVTTTSTWAPDIGELNTTGQTQTSVALLGASIGDLALSSFSYTQGSATTGDLHGCRLSAYVEQANVATVVLSIVNWNADMDWIDLQSGTLKVAVLKT